MRKLDVNVELNGQKVKVGTIVGNDASDACFAYCDEYILSAGSVPISISLPFEKKNFTAEQTKNFFEGLLPEGFTRRSVAKWMHVDADDYLSILSGLGRECLGALRISDSEFPDPEPSYQIMTTEEVRNLAREGATTSAQLVTKAHLSLTGASGKVGLYYDDDTGDWYLPIGDAPSTHIVKQSHIRLDGIVANEQLSLLAAKKLGIEVPDSFIINTGNARDEDVLFATKRYDRVRAWDFQTARKKVNTRLISDIQCPVRLHQEDMAQALGISAAQKYEHEGQQYLKRIFDLLRHYSSNPIEDQMKLWDILIFDFLVGNSDNHIKNISLLYSRNLKSIRLAPAYDIISTVIYESHTKEMGIAIGGEFDLDVISRDSFERAAKEVGLGKKMALKRFDRMCAAFEGALKGAAMELSDKGFESAEVMSEKIMNCGGIAHV